MRLLIIGLIFVSCSTKYEPERPTVEGDWMFIESPEEITIDYVGLRFESDTLYTIQDRGLFQEGKYSISEDTIIVEEFGPKINKRRRVKKLTKDSLILSDGSHYNKYYSRKLEYTETLKLNDLKIVSEGCFGECPEFTFTLTKNGHVRFRPTLNCKVTDEREFILDEDKKNKIDSLFRWTYLHKLDTNKIYGAIDGWALDIQIDYNNGNQIEIKTTHSHIPFRLKRIFSVLINDLRERGLI